MKKTIIFLSVCLLLLALSGCGRTAMESLQVDTVVRIPMDPEETEPSETAPAASETETEPPAETQGMEPEATTAVKSSGKTSAGSNKSSSSSGKTSSSSGKTGSSSGKNNSSSKTDKEESVKQTTPPETEAAKPTATAPLETEAQQPVETVPPETEATQPPETVPPETEDPAAGIYDISDYTMGSIAYGIADEINACRAEAELGELSLDGQLSAIASVRAYEAFLSWSTTRPDGRSGASVLGDYGYGYSVTAEHLCNATGSGDAAAIAAKWMNSDKHRQNILSEGFVKLGVGEYSAGGIAYVAVIFIG